VVRSRRVITHHLLDGAPVRVVTESPNVRSISAMNTGPRGLRTAATRTRSRYKSSGMDSVAALLSAMVDAAGRFDAPYFNKIDADKKYRDVIPYITAVHPEWFHDMRIAGTEPNFTADEPVIFQHADGRRAAGRIALGYPWPGHAEYKPICRALLDGLDEHRGVTLEADTPFQALQLAMASLATRLRAFLAAGGRVLTPAGDADIDLGTLFGPLWLDAVRSGSDTAR
jgi:hypothetical protein